MSSWEPIQELRVDDLRFHPDGTIGLSGKFLPVEVAIESAIVGSVTVRKNPGVSSEVHVSDGNGQLLVLKFEDGHWWKRGSLASAQVTPFPAVHSRGVRFSPPVHRAPEGDAEAASSKAPSTVMLLASGVLVLFALYLVREPLRLVLVGEVEHHRVERLKAEEAAGTQAMRSRFQAESDRIAQRLKEVQERAARLEARFREIVGMELARAASHPSERPREVDTMILRSPAFGEAWTAVLNAQPPNDLGTTIADTVRDIERGVRDGTFTETDEKQLADLEALLSARRKSMDEAIDHLAYMERSLRAERFEENRRTQERRQP